MRLPARVSDLPTSCCEAGKARKHQQPEIYHVDIDLNTHVNVERRELVLRETAENERAEVVQEREVECLERHRRARRGVEEDVKVLVVLLGDLLDVLGDDKVLRLDAELLRVLEFRVRVREGVDFGTHGAGNLEGCLS